MAVTVVHVEPGSCAERLGLIPGDRILSVNGRTVADELDFHFYVYGGSVLPLIVAESRKGKRSSLKIPLEDEMDLGLRFEDFSARTCRNKCIFCFVHQLPKGVRRSLRVRDDDFRLSFLHGNYLSLTNLQEEDVRRIIDQRISPLYVSVHSTNPRVRSHLLGCRQEDCSLGTLWRLVRAGIQVHAQIVLCPGINDRTELRKTLQRLFRFYPGVASVAVVPVGLTRHRRHLPELKPVTAPLAGLAVSQVHALQGEFFEKSGTRFAFLADEFYLLAGAPIPSADCYEGFLQLEDGVGMLASFHQDYNRIVRRRPSMGGLLEGTLVTGQLFAPFLEKLARRLQRLYGGHLRVVRVENRFLGPGVTVAGLLSGRDILQALEGRDIGHWVIVPGECLSQDRRLFLDDLTMQDLQMTLGVPVKDAKRSAAGFFEALQRLSRRPKKAHSLLC